MGYDLRRAGVTVLCVVSLLLAASLFPATGFGDYPNWSPGGVAPGGSPSDPADPGGGSGPGETETAGTATTTATTTTTTTGTTTTETTTATTETESTTTTTTSTTTTSTTTTTERRDDAGILGALVGLLGALVSLLAYVILAGVGFGGMLALAVAVGAVSWRQPDETRVVVDVWGLPEFALPVGSTVQTVPQMTTGFLVGVGNTVPAVLDDVGNLTRGLGAGLVAVADGLGRTTGEVLTGIPSSLAGVASGTGSVLSGSLLAIPKGLSSVASGLSNPLGGDGVLPGSDARSVADDPGGSGEGDEEPRPPESVEEAWARMVEFLAVYDHESKTPAEIARIAVDRGFPEDAVGRLTVLFRRVRYGGEAGSPDNLEAARAAVREIRNGLEGE